MSYESIKRHGEKHGYSQRDKRIHFKATTANINMLEKIAQGASNESSCGFLRDKICELKKEKDYVLNK